MSARAVSTDELTGGGPIVVFAPTLADACLGCGALLAACFAHRGALVVTTLAATAPSWMSGAAAPRTAVPEGVRVSPPAVDGWGALEPERTSRRVERGLADETDLLAPLAALGGTAAAVRTLSLDGAPAEGDRRRPDRTAADLAELCRAFGVRSMLLPSTRHGSTRHVDVVEAAALRVREGRDDVRTWRYPVGAPSATARWTAERERLVRMFDATPWHTAKREALVRMHAAGFELPDMACLRASSHDRPGALAALPERYLRESDA